MRATYDRQVGQGRASYSINSISLSPFTVFFESTEVLFKGIFVLVFSCLVFIMLFGSILHTFGVLLGFLCSIGATIFVGRRDLQTLAHMAGSRRPTSLQVTDTKLEVSRGSGPLIAIGLESIRWVSLANTLNSNFTSEPTYIVGTGFQGAVTANTLTVRAARIPKLARDCFSVLLDYGNDTVVVADGLDEITAKNILDDLARDLKMR